MSSSSRATKRWPTGEGERRDRVAGVDLAAGASGGACGPRRPRARTRMCRRPVRRSRGRPWRRPPARRIRRPIRASVPRGSAPPARTPRRSVALAGEDVDDRRGRARRRVSIGDVVVVGAEVEGAGGAFGDARACPSVAARRRRSARPGRRRRRSRRAAARPAVTAIRSGSKPAKAAAAPPCRSSTACPTVPRRRRQAACVPVSDDPSRTFFGDEQAAVGVDRHPVASLRSR